MESLFSSEEIIASIAEMHEKSDSTVQLEAALKWAKRAIGCYRIFGTTGRTNHLERATEYANEAIEHAAFVDDDESGDPLLPRLRAELLTARKEAQLAVVGRAR